MATNYKNSLPYPKIMKLKKTGTMTILALSDTADEGKNIVILESTVGGRIGELAKSNDSIGKTFHDYDGVIHEEWIEVMKHYITIEYFPYFVKYDSIDERVQAHIDIIEKSRILRREKAIQRRRNEKSYAV